MTWREMLEKSARAEEKYLATDNKKYLIEAEAYLQRAKDAPKG